MKITRRAYAEMFGPTTGDRVRLADTDLWIEVERDHTTYGEEVKFGGGKVIRDGMGQSQRVAADVPDTIITNAVILDHWGIVKADIAIKHGRIAAIGQLAGGVTVIGGLLGFLFIDGHEAWLPFMLVIASSSYVYVALADLIPQLQKRLSATATAMQILWLLSGIALVTLATQLMHVH